MLTVTVSIVFVRGLSAATSYGSYTNSKTQPSKGSEWNLFNKISENKVQYKLCYVKQTYHIDNNDALSFESESPCRKWATAHKSAFHSYQCHHKK